MVGRTHGLLKDFIDSEKGCGFILLFCTLFSLLLSISGFGYPYVEVWNKEVGAASFSHITNDGSMTIFFLLPGFFLFSFLAVKTGLGLLSPQLRWKHVRGIGILAGIGFTIAIFISMLAFRDEAVVGQSKIPVLMASVLTAIVGFVYLNTITKGGRVEAKNSD